LWWWVGLAVKRRKQAMQAELSVDSSRRRLVCSATQSVTLADPSLALHLTGRVDGKTGKADGLARLQARYTASSKPSTLRLDCSADVESRRPRSPTLRARAKKKVSLSRLGSLTASAKACAFATALDNSPEIHPRLQLELTQRLVEPLSANQDWKVKVGWNAITQEPYIEARENLLRIRAGPKLWSANFIL
jgi:hypothetical protein